METSTNPPSDDDQYPSASHVATPHNRKGVRFWIATLASGLAVALLIGGLTMKLANAAGCGTPDTGYALTSLDDPNNELARNKAGANHGTLIEGTITPNLPDSCQLWLLHKQANTGDYVAITSSNVAVAEPDSSPGRYRFLDPMVSGHDDKDVSEFVFVAATQDCSEELLAWMRSGSRSHPKLPDGCTTISTFPVHGLMWPRK